MQLIEHEFVNKRNQHTNYRTRGRQAGLSQEFLEGRGGGSQKDASWQYLLEVY